MVKINWSEVDHFKTLVLRQGKSDSHEFSIIILYHGKRDSERVPVQLARLASTLYEIESNRSVRGIYIYDLDCKRVFLKFCDARRIGTLEEVPVSGHPNILLEFKGMTPEGKDVWVDITEAAIQNYLSSTGV